MSAVSAGQVGWIIKKQAEREMRWRPDGTTHSVPRCAPDDLWRCPLIHSDVVKSVENYVSVRRVNLFAKVD